MPIVSQSPRLRGIIIRDPSDTLVVQATPEQIHEFGAARNNEVELSLVSALRRDSSGVDHEFMNYFTTGVDDWVVSRSYASTGTLPPSRPALNLNRVLAPGEPVLSAAGEVIGTIRNASLQTERIDITTFADRYQQYIPGRRSIMLELDMP